MKNKTLLRATGRRKNVFELIDAVLSDYHLTRASMADIAQVNKVSTTTVSKIVDQRYYVIVDGLQVTFGWDDEARVIFAEIDGEKKSIDRFI